MAAAALVSLVFAVGCGAQAKPKTDNDAVIYLKTSVSDAKVYVNGHFIRQIKDLHGGLALSPGRHRIEIQHDRYHTVYLDLKVEKRERRTIPVKLAEVLP